MIPWRLLLSDEPAARPVPPDTVLQETPAVAAGEPVLEPGDNAGQRLIECESSNLTSELGRTVIDPHLRRVAVPSAVDNGPAVGAAVAAAILDSKHVRTDGPGHLLHFLEADAQGHAVPRPSHHTIMAVSDDGCPGCVSLLPRHCTGTAQVGRPTYPSAQ